MNTTPHPTLPSGSRHVPRHRAERRSRSGLPVARRLAVGAVAGLALSATVTTLAPPAPASATGSGRHDSRQDQRERQQERLRNPFGLDGAHDEMSGPNRKPEEPASYGVVAIAASKAGTPYVYGATGPDAFDCSGFTAWVYARVGKTLPRTSAAQAGAVDRISAAAARPGDLVFFTGGGGVYHVGIYAGGHAVWHAPRPGEGVRREAIWTSSVFYGRVR